MKIRIARKGEPSREVSPEQAAEEIVSGGLSLTDLAQPDSAPEWMALGDVPEVKALSDKPKAQQAAQSNKGPETLPQAQASIFEALAQASESYVDRLLMAFQADLEADGVLRVGTAMEFFHRVLCRASDATHSCSVEFSEILNRYSSRPEMRNKPAEQLYSEVRNAVFAPADDVLSSYAEGVRGIMRQVKNLPEERSILGAAITGAAVGQVVGGFGRSGKVLGTAGAIATAGSTFLEEGSRVTQEKLLFLDASQLAYSKACEYVQAVGNIPGLLIHYACTECFGELIDPARLPEVVQRANTYANHKVELAHSFILDLQELEFARAKGSTTKTGHAQQVPVRGGYVPLVGPWVFYVIAGLVGVPGLLAVVVLMFSSESSWVERLAALGGTVTWTGAFIFFGWRIQVKMRTAQKQKAPPVPVPKIDAPPQAKVCAYCGRENSLDAVSCRECGTPDFKPAVK